MSPTRSGFSVSLTSQANYPSEEHLKPYSGPCLVIFVNCVLLINTDLKRFKRDRTISWCIKEVASCTGLRTPNLASDYGSFLQEPSGSLYTSNKFYLFLYLIFASVGRLSS